MTTGFPQAQKITGFLQAQMTTGFPQASGITFQPPFTEAKILL